MLCMWYHAFLINLCDLSAYILRGCLTYICDCTDGNEIILKDMDRTRTNYNKPNSISLQIVAESKKSSCSRCFTGGIGSCHFGNIRYSHWRHVGISFAIYNVLTMKMWQFCNESPTDLRLGGTWPRDHINCLVWFIFVHQDGCATWKSFQGQIVEWEYPIGSGNFYDLSFVRLCFLWCSLSHIICTLFCCTMFCCV